MYNAAPPHPLAAAWDEWPHAVHPRGRGGPRRLRMTKIYLFLEQFEWGGRDSNASQERAGNTEKPSTSEGRSERDISRNGGKSPISRHLATGSRPFAQRVTELGAAIANVTRALGRAADEAVELLVAERAEMRAELSAL